MSNPSLVAYELEFIPRISPANAQQSAMIEAISIRAHHAGGEALGCVFENDGLWKERLAELFGDAGGLAIWAQIEMGENARHRHPVTREMLERLRFHPDVLRIA